MNLDVVVEPPVSPPQGAEIDLAPSCFAQDGTASWREFQATTRVEIEQKRRTFRQLLAKLAAVPEKDLQVALEESRMEMDDGAEDGDDGEDDKEEEDDGDLQGVDPLAPKPGLSDAVRG